MRIKELKDGKISVWAETDPDAERFLTAVYKEGLKWPSGNLSGKAKAKREYACGYCSPSLSYVDDDRGWHSNHVLNGKAFKSITVKEFFEEYTMEDFKAGKVVATFPNKEEREKFLRRPELANIKRCNFLAKCSDTNLYASANMGNLCSKKNPPSNLPSVPYTDLLPGIPDEQITARYNLDGTVTAVYKKDGNVVERATVKRYHTDKDDLRVATKHALEKMLGEAKPKDYNAIVDRRYKCGEKGLTPYRLMGGPFKSPDINRILAILDAWDAAHPAQPTKPAQPKPAEYKVGDKVRVHWDDEHGSGVRKEDAGIVNSVDAGDTDFPFRVQFPSGNADWFSRNASSNKTARVCIADYIIGRITPPFDKDGEPNYRVGQKVLLTDGSTGEIRAVDTSKNTNMHYRVRSNRGWVFDRDILGLADDA